MTDHGDAFRRPAAPRYIGGVLCIEGVEISTAGGHYAALGMSAPPYPLGGEARDVVEDVARLGGFGVAAHPDSAKQELRWDEWDAPFDAMEWFNADSQWRDEVRWRLLPAILQYPLRPSASVASLFDRPVGLLRRWDDLGARRHGVGLAAADAHARMGLGGKADPYDESVYVKLPSYEAMFRPSMRVERGAAGRHRGCRRRGRRLRAGGRRRLRRHGGPGTLSCGGVWRGRGPTGNRRPGGASAAARHDERPAARVAVAAARRRRRPPVEAPLDWEALRAAYWVEAHLPEAPGDPPLPRT
jgi:hypothetical protein